MLSQEIGEPVLLLSGVSGQGTSEVLERLGQALEERESCASEA